jgi:hypothetical protein
VEWLFAITVERKFSKALPTLPVAPEMMDYAKGRSGAEDRKVWELRYLKNIKTRSGIHTLSAPEGRGFKAS